MKINRLLEMTIILINKKKTTARDMAARFGVSTRTIYRDIDVLSTAGVPVYTTKGKNGGICLLDDYYIGGTAMKASEADSLRIALETLKATKYPDVDTVIHKLGSVFKGKPKDISWIKIDFSPWGSTPNEDHRFSNIRDAIVSHRMIVFDYTGSNGQSGRRRVEPYVLWYKGSGWYLFGYCMDKHDFRLFRMTRIKALTLNQETFIERTLPDEEQKFKQDDLPMVTLKLKFKPNIRYRIFDDFNSDYIALDGDGGGRVSVTFPAGDWVIGYLLSYGDGIEVLAPESMRDAVKKRILAMGNNY